MLSYKNNARFSNYMVYHFCFTNNNLPNLKKIIQKKEEII